VDSHEIIVAQQKKEYRETTHDEIIDAMIDEDVNAAIDTVLSEGITHSLKSLHSVQGQKVSKLDSNILPAQLLQEFRYIAFKEDLAEKLKEGLIPKVNFNAVKEKIDANAYAFSSRQLEHVGVVVSLLNNIVWVFEKLENLKKVRDSTKKNTGKDYEALKKTRQKILTSKTSFTNNQIQLDSLDAKIADLKAKLEKLQGERAKIAENQDQEKDKITSLNIQVKSIFHRLVDDQIKLKSVEDQIPEAQTELENHEKLYRIFKATPPF
jgi:chromosome segregation ATPase